MRTLDILDLFLHGATALTAGEIVQETGLPRSTVHELLATLVARGYLQKNPTTGQYRLGVTVLHLGNAYAERFDLLGAANAAARALSDEVRETASVAILQGTSVFYLAKVERRALMPIPSNIGERLPASCTALGKALLAALPDETIRRMYADGLPVMTDDSIRNLDDLLADLYRTRERGYAMEAGESTPHLRCLAATVRNVDGDTVAAISVSVPDVRWRPRTEQEWAQAVLGAAGALSAELGYQADAGVERDEVTTRR